MRALIIGLVLVMTTACGSSIDNEYECFTLGQALHEAKSNSDPDDAALQEMASLQERYDNKCPM